MISFSVLFLSLVLGVFGAEVAPRVTQNDGSKIPVVGLGAMALGADAYTVVTEAIEAGYRHIDTSPEYGSEKDIGRAVNDLIKAGKIKREDLYLVTKLNTADHPRSKVPAAIKLSLSKMNLTYVDLYLIHSPQGFGGGDHTNVDTQETWAGMEDVHKSGLAKSIGVSNFNEAQMDHVLAKAVVKPVTNQVNCNPYNNQKKLLDYLTKKNITLTAYSPLSGSGGVTKLLADPKIAPIATAHKVSTAQVVLKYQLQRNVIVIPRSTKKEYVIENIDLFKFKLTDAEMKVLDSLNH